MMLAETVSGWKVRGSRSSSPPRAATAPTSGYPGAIRNPEGVSTKKRFIQGIDGDKLTLNAPLDFDTWAAVALPRWSPT